MVAFPGAGARGEVIDRLAREQKWMADYIAEYKSVPGWDEPFKALWRWFRDNPQ